MDNAYKEKQKEYFKRYSKENLRRISLNLNLNKDKDILEAIEREDPQNIQRGIKNLIRKGITYQKFTEKLSKRKIGRAHV